MREVSTYIAVDVLIAKLHDCYSVCVSFDGVDSIQTPNIAWEPVEHLVNVQALKSDWTWIQVHLGLGAT